MVSVTCVPSVQEAERLRLHLQEHADAAQAPTPPAPHCSHELFTARQGTEHSLFVLQELCPAKFSSRGCAPAPCRIAVRAGGPNQGGFEGGGWRKIELILQGAAEVTHALILHASVTLLIDTGPRRSVIIHMFEDEMLYEILLRAARSRTHTSQACPTPAGQYGSSSRAGHFRFYVRISVSL